MDRAALDAAIEMSLPHGGYVPRGRLAEDGPLPRKYQMTETASPEYAVRTEMNVLAADATLILHRGPLTGGTKYTAALCHRHKKPNCVINLEYALAQAAVAEAGGFIALVKPKVLNVAGPRESVCRGIYQEAKMILMRVFELIKKNSLKAAVTLVLLSAFMPSVVEAGSSCFDSPANDAGAFLDLPPGYRYSVLLESGQRMADGRSFPFRPDLNVYVPLPGNRGLLIVSHELAADFRKEWGPGALTKHYLIDGNIKESRLLAEGMRNNCSGSLTPWGTVLTNEEFPREPYENYPDEGYVWEVDYVTGEKWRRDGLGRFSHESSVVAPDGFVYMTEDFSEGLLYRFVPKNKGDLSAGRLEVYRRDQKNWVAVDDVYHARAEGAVRGGTPFNRLEGLALSPGGRFLYISETGEKDPKKKDPYGRIYKMSLKDFSLSVFFEGSGSTMSNPDNIVFDQRGSLWTLEDQFSANIKKHGGNEVWVIRPNGQPCLFGRFRDDSCEATGPEFTPDGKSLFLNIQCDNQPDKTIKITGF